MKGHFISTSLTHLIFWPGNWSHSLFLFFAQLGSPSCKKRFSISEREKISWIFLSNLEVWVALLLIKFDMEYSRPQKVYGWNIDIFYICGVLLPNIHNPTKKKMQRNPLGLTKFSGLCFQPKFFYFF